LCSPYQVTEESDLNLETYARRSLHPEIQAIRVHKKTRFLQTKCLIRWITGIWKIDKKLIPVLQIRDVYPGLRIRIFFIPDSEFNNNKKEEGKIN
jgi:hypothetical protein